MSCVPLLRDERVRLAAVTPADYPLIIFPTHLAPSVVGIYSFTPIIWYGKV